MLLKVCQRQLIGINIHSEDSAHLFKMLSLESLGSQACDDGQVLLDHL